MRVGCGAIFLWQLVTREPILEHHLHNPAASAEPELYHSPTTKGSSISSKRRGKRERQEKKKQKKREQKKLDAMLVRPTKQKKKLGGRGGTCSTVRYSAKRKGNIFLYFSFFFSFC